jgi:glycosyltransferase involved in cell wall biosynthesis
MLAAPVFSKWLSVPLMTLIRGNDFDASIFTPRKKNVMEDAFAASSKVCVVSGDKKQKIESLYPSVDVAFVPNGIQLNDWIPSLSERDFATEWKTTHAQNKNVVGLIGQLKAKKGISFFFSSLNNSTLLEKLHFLLVGELSEEVLAEITEKKISYSHYPFLDRYELLKYYCCCDVLAIPSFYDGMPNVLLEAGALGIPVIASNVDGMKDVIIHEQTGFLFQAGNANTCRKAIYDFLTLSPEDRKHMGNQLKETIQLTYNDTLELESYETIIKNILGADRPSLQLRTAFE